MMVLVLLPCHPREQHSLFIGDLQEECYRGIQADYAPAGIGCSDWPLYRAPVHSTDIYYESSNGNVALVKRARTDRKIRTL